MTEKEKNKKTWKPSVTARRLDFMNELANIDGQINESEKEKTNE